MFIVSNAGIFIAQPEFAKGIECRAAVQSFLSLLGYFADVDDLGLLSTRQDTRMTDAGFSTQSFTAE